MTKFAGVCCLYSSVERQVLFAYGEEVGVSNGNHTYIYTVHTYGTYIHAGHVGKLSMYDAR